LAASNSGREFEYLHRRDVVQERRSVILTKPERDGANPSWTLARSRDLAGSTLCIILFIFVQWQLLVGTTAAPEGSIGSALWHWVVGGRVPQDGPHVWYQVNAVIPKVAMAKLPANVAQRAGPVIDWLTGSGGLQRGSSARVLLDGDSLIVDVYNIDEIGCRRIMGAARAGRPPIDSIAVTATAADMIPVSANTPEDDQCSKGTSFIRTLSLARH
jgi:hypothetical protein